MASRRKQAFTPQLVPKPPCRGCDNCPMEPQVNDLFVLGYNGKWYCRTCFFKIAVRWPKPQPKREKK